MNILHGSFNAGGSSPRRALGMAFGAAAVPGAEDASSGDGEQVAEDRCGKPTVKASGNDQKHWCFGPHLYISCSKNHSSPKKGRFFPPPPVGGWKTAI